MMIDDTVKSLLVELFEILDTEEETDEGRVFRPTTFSSCRSDHVARMDYILKHLKLMTEKQNEQD